MLQFYNTLSRTKEVFEPIVPGEVRLYTCGPTVYDYAHIGNFRAYVFEDLLRRYLKFRGFKVIQVMNLTDVDDKTIRAARESGVPLAEVTEKFKDAFFDDLRTLGIEPAEHYPAATDHVDEMVELVQRLKNAGATYEVDGSTYFRIKSFQEYGKLSHFSIEDLESGASGRVDTDEYGKEDVRDFVLWKAWSPEDGDVVWDTPIGRGRPGWHIECSAMSMKYLGEQLDIHTGGVDNVFPHHENEIAQSEMATGKPFVRCWLHCEHLIVDGRKMSKSLGNFYTLGDLLEKGAKGEAIRYALISTHYRQQYNFTMDGLHAAQSAVQRLRDLRQRLHEVRDEEGEDVSELLQETEQRFTQFLDDDLNIAPALAAVFDMARGLNRLLDAYRLSRGSAQKTIGLLERLDRVLGILQSEDDVPTGILDLVAERQQARRAKEFARADELRDAILAKGYVVEDTPDGPRVKKI